MLYLGVMALIEHGTYILFLCGLYNALITFGLYRRSFFSCVLIALFPLFLLLLKSFDGSFIIDTLLQEMLVLSIWIVICCTAYRVGELGDYFNPSSSNESKK